MSNPKTKATEMQPDEIKAAVRAHYANRLSSDQDQSCCSSASQSMGYSARELESIPQGANLGAGCGNPVGLASLQIGHHVLDLGSGAGIDCFLAAEQVGPTGRVIGVDMLVEMVTRARSFVRKNHLDQVEFRLGEIECLPVETSTIDVILSNCVINLSPEKERVLKEAFRVLKPGGRIAFSDVVLTAEMPEEMRQDVELYSCCGSGAWPIATWHQRLEALGFESISVAPKEESRALIRTWSPNTPLDDSIVSADIAATKPTKLEDRMNLEQEQKTVLRVYDPAMCCSTGVCGPSVDPQLAAFSADLDWLKSQGVEVERFNLAQQPGAFAENAQVKEALSQRGDSSLPLLLLGSSIVSSGIYPTREQLAALTGRKSAVESAPAPQSSCCSPKSSCC